MKRQPNWLLRCLVGVSLGIHVVIFMHVAGIYRSKEVTCIELTLQGISKPTTRSIPRPRHRTKAPVQPDVKRLKIEPVEKDLPDSLVEGISMPDIPAIPGLQIANWSPEEIVKASGDYDASLRYLEMVRLKIEKYKDYPGTARARQIEGSVTVRFVITLKGGVRAVEIAKSSQHNLLDKAALRAVKAAAPFPKPPKHFFKEEIPLELTIVFELT